MTVTQVSDEEWDQAYDYVPICALPVRPDVLAEEFGIRFIEGREGLGKLLYAFVKLDDKVIFLAAHPEGPTEAQFVHVRVQGNEPEPDTAVALAEQAFGFADEELEWKSPILEEKRWILCRVDKNGREFEIDRFLVRCIAENVAARYEMQNPGESYVVRKA